jgi:SAM-dependent methyltransferase
MDAQERKAHWDGIYASKGEADVSWFQETAATSLDLLDAGSLSKSSAIIDIGGGTSRLVDALIERGYSDITVLDVSETALRTARQRLGARAGRVRWIQADIVAWVPPAVYDAWHDRAVLHFLIAEEDRKGYVRALRAGLAPNGIALISTFAPDGPETCSGLPVQRYSPASLSALLGSEFRLIGQRLETHRTPWGAGQAFQFSLFRRIGDRDAGGHVD